MFEARFSFVSNVVLLVVTYYFANEITPIFGIFVVAASFGAAITVFVEFLQGRTEPKEAVPIFMVDAVIYIWIASIVNISLGIIDTTGTICDAPCPVNELGSSIYFTLVTFTTLGYGDLQPTQSLRLVAGTQALLGYVFLGLSVASIQHWVQVQREK